MKLAEFPPNVQIELNNFCNARCITCPIPTMKRKSEIMDFGLFSKIISELEAREFRGQVLPFLNGEALLVPNVLDYLRLIKSRLPESAVTLYTNASKLSDELGRTILRERLLDTLAISFDGGTKKSYEAVCRGLSFESVKENVHRFVGNRDKLPIGKPRVRITMVVTPENCHTKRDLHEEFKDADEIDFCFMFNFAGVISKAPEGRYGRLRNLLTKSNFCPQMFEQIYILVNGDVCLCCFDYEGKEIVGNVKESSIEEVWLGGKLTLKREQLRKRAFLELPLCRNCDVINHNLVTQLFLRMRPLIQSKFPKVANTVVKLYKRVLLRK